MQNLDTKTDHLLATLDDDGIATITLNRPEKRNALSSELTPALRTMLLELEAMPEARVIVLTGAGTAFCSGGDVSGMGANRVVPEGHKPTTQEAIRNLQNGQESLALRLYDLAKPTIAALPGAAAGAGLSIALACDLRIAVERAFVTTAFANIGASGDYGSSWFLPQLVGVSKAKELFYTARRVSAEEGLALGIFNQVVPDDQLAEATLALARTIADGPPVALRYMKENLNRSARADLRSCLMLEADRMVRSMQTKDHKEAVAAFMEKRKPSFAGR